MSEAYGISLPELLRILPPDALQKVQEVLGDSFSDAMAARRAACRELRQLCDDAVSHVVFDAQDPALGAFGAALAGLFPNCTRLTLRNVETERCVSAALDGLPAAVRERLSGITITSSHECWLDYAAVVDLRDAAATSARLPRLLATISAAWPRLQTLSLPRVCHLDLAAAVGALAARLTRVVS
ncbi:hypothetical protein HXX76_014760 [Chlamydomonas incerta]|uniref:Uncharacterized protein n=1 Tax=Chlamydomonas incerta TaxID=51695 RepID=A0A835SKN0_CHLIN|nr:hypothetical protein HXX76_014760 [Chlamydomonas incerta]|eukprot:KAG2424084.1 hypothetical protein HXX76_014760 [Chlamydomonas incerta]